MHGLLYTVCTFFAYIMHLLHGILYRCASEQEAIATAEGQKYLPTQTGAALNGLGLIQYHVLPLDSVKILHILDHLVIRRGEKGERGEGGEEERKEREGGREGITQYNSWKVRLGTHQLVTSNEDVKRSTLGQLEGRTACQGLGQLEGRTVRQGVGQLEGRTARQPFEGAATLP